MQRLKQDQIYFKGVTPILTDEISTSRETIFYAKVHYFLQSQNKTGK